MKHKGISVSGRKINDNTYDEIYPKTLEKLLLDANQYYGVRDISELDDDLLRSLINRRVKDFHSNGNTKQSSNINSILAAVKSFNYGVQETNVFKNDKKFSLGDTDAIRKDLGKANVRRYSRNSTTLRATPEQCEKVLENIKTQGYKNKTRELAYHISYIAYKTGSRISAALKLRADDIDVNGTKITFFKDKGGLTRTVDIDKETADYLKELKKGRRGDQKIFLTQRKDGTKKSIEETRKAINRIVENAGKEFTRVDREKMRDEKGNFRYVEVTKTFKSHAFRKGFCVNRTYEYLKKFENPKEMNDYIKKRVEEDPRIGDKLRNLYQRINKSRHSPRNIKPQEYAVFFTSVDVGHFRVDVLNQYYTTYKEVKAYFDGKK